MTRLHSLVADLRHAKLCMLGASLSCDNPLFMLTQSPERGFLVIFLHSSFTNSSHCYYHQDDPLIQSP